MIETVVFDVGMVFVRLMPQPILELMSRHGARTHDLPSLVSSIELEAHETGALPGRGFLANIASLSPAPPPLEMIHAHWNDMFELDANMVALAHRLAERYRVYLLSNVGDLHWTHLAREYGIHRIGHGALPSFVAGVMKPHGGIYAAAEQRFGFAPQHAVFIDDRFENIAAALERGWGGIVHRSFETTRDELRQMGVEA
jgi:FMN phosphatase YigB (HAD superfamily)